MPQPSRGDSNLYKMPSPTGVKAVETSKMSFLFPIESLTLEEPYQGMERRQRLITKTYPHTTITYVDGDGGWGGNAHTKDTQLAPWSTDLEPRQNPDDERAGGCITINGGEICPPKPRPTPTLNVEADAPAVTGRQLTHGEIPCTWTHDHSRTPANYCKRDTAEMITSAVDPAVADPVLSASGFCDLVWTTDAYGLPSPTCVGLGGATEGAAPTVTDPAIADRANAAPGNAFCSVVQGPWGIDYTDCRSTEAGFPTVTALDPRDSDYGCLTVQGPDGKPTRKFLWRDDDGDEAEAMTAASTGRRGQDGPVEIDAEPTAVSPRDSGHGLFCATQTIFGQVATACAFQPISNDAAPAAPMITDRQQIAEPMVAGSSSCTISTAGEVVGTVCVGAWLPVTTTTAAAPAAPMVTDRQQNVELMLAGTSSCRTQTGDGYVGTVCVGNVDLMPAPTVAAQLQDNLDLYDASPVESGWNCSSVSLPGGGWSNACGDPGIVIVRPPAAPERQDELVTHAGQYYPDPTAASEPRDPDSGCLGCGRSILSAPPAVTASARQARDLCMTPVINGKPTTFCVGMTSQTESPIIPNNERAIGADVPMSAHLLSEELLTSLGLPSLELGSVTAHMSMNVVPTPVPDSNTPHMYASHFTNKPPPHTITFPATDPTSLVTAIITSTMTAGIGGSTGGTVDLSGSFDTIWSVTKFIRPLAIILPILLAVVLLVALCVGILTFCFYKKRPEPKRGKEKHDPVARDVESGPPRPDDLQKPPPPFEEVPPLSHDASPHAGVLPTASASRQGSVVPPTNASRQGSVAPTTGAFREGSMAAPATDPSRQGSVAPVAPGGASRQGSVAQPPTRQPTLPTASRRSTIQEVGTDAEKDAEKDV